MEKTPLARIERRFTLNMGRVASLTSIYENTPEKSIPNAQRQDLLRSAVVFIHASIEDMVRELLKWKNPIESDTFAGSLKFVMDPDGFETKDKITIAELRRWKDKTVSSILDESTEVHLKKRSFNDTTELASTIKLLGVDVQTFEAHLPAIAECMVRRHNIVHRSDRPDHTLFTHGQPTALSFDDVKKWYLATGQVGKLLFAALAPPPKPPSIKKAVRLQIPKRPKKISK